MSTFGPFKVNEWPSQWSIGETNMSLKTGRMLLQTKVMNQVNNGAGGGGHSWGVLLGGQIWILCFHEKYGNISVVWQSKMTQMNCIHHFF